MASLELYPPTIDSIIPAFLTDPVDENNQPIFANCRVYFSLSKYSTISPKDITEVHVSIFRINDSTSAVANTASFFNGIKRANDIIFKKWDADEEKPGYHQVSKAEGKDNLYYIDINEEDIANINKGEWKTREDGSKYLDGDGNYLWEADQIYKIQIRLAASGDNTIFKNYSYYSNISKYLVECGQDFSEWSRIATTKAINKPEIELLNPPKEDLSFSLNTVPNFLAKYSYTPNNLEGIDSYDIKLYKKSDTESELLEEYNNLYPVKINDVFYLQKDFSTQLKDLGEYYFELKYSTINYYEEIIKYNFVVEQKASSSFEISYVEEDSRHSHNTQSSLEEENKDKKIYSTYKQLENGFIEIKITNKVVPALPLSCDILRADENSNFTKWSVIKNLKNVLGSEYIYDYNIESNIKYKYMVQEYISDYDGNIEYPVKCWISPVITEDEKALDYEYSYLLSKDNVQLALKYNNTMNNLKINIGESQFDTIGNRYASVLRNGTIQYKTFPINGMIASAMDEDKIFYDESYFDAYSLNTKIEKKFRDKVIDFLQNPSPKVFKSPTEGNMIIYLKDISFEPIQSLNRVLYNFSANAVEIDEYNYENCLKYGIIDYNYFEEV